MGSYTLVLILALFAAAWWLLRRRAMSPKAGRQQATASTSKKGSEYHAVSIRHENDACKAARALAGQRYLATAAPRLPLPECNARECRCRFVHHEDRRSGRERRSPFAPAGSIGATGTYEQEQRSGRDRRRSEDYF